jgi:hypothetical protein
MIQHQSRPVIMLVLLTLLLLSTALPAGAADRDPFSSGSGRASVLIGNGYAFNESYLIVGVGVGYYFAKGLEVGLDAEFWSGSDPGITKISPSVRYVVPTGSALRPYVGAFYRRTLIDNYDDLNSTGGRAGLYLVSGQGSYFGAGVVYENYLSCNQSVYLSCSDTYPEIIFAIAF